jgi:hypothetical protein
MLAFQHKNFEKTETGHSSNQNTSYRIIEIQAGQRFLLLRQELEGSTGLRKGVLLGATAEPVSQLQRRWSLNRKRCKPSCPDRKTTGS